MAREGALITDSSADFPAALVDELGLEAFYFYYIIDDESHLDDFGRTIPRTALYDAMRAGAHASTAQLTRQEFVEVFRRHAEAGTPVLYFALSSGLSGTYDTAVTARQEVLAEFPEATITIVDTKAASVAEGLMVYEAALKWNDGMPLAEIAEWATEARHRLHGYFTVEDLEYLKRGGRLPATAASVGTLLDVKPILQLTPEGKLAPLKNVRGRHKSMRALAGLFAERCDDPLRSRVFIAHGDCLDDAEELAALVRGAADVGEVRVFEAGSVIGSHGGPGFLGMVFWGRRQ